jgi:excisionase family DNA binding protein
MTAESNELLAVSIDQAARRAGVGRGFLYQEIGKGRLRARKAGRRTLVTLADLGAWLEALPSFTTERSASFEARERSATLNGS